VKLFFLATANKKSTSNSPYAFTHQLSSRAILAADGEVAELFDDFDVLARRYSQPALGDYLRTVVSRLGGSHLGILHHLLFQIFKLRAQGEVTNDGDVAVFFLGTKFKFLYHGIPNLFEIYLLPKRSRDILSLALDGPVTPSPITDRDAYETLLKLGFFINGGDLASFEFAAPLIRRVAFNQLLSAFPGPV